MPVGATDATGRGKESVEGGKGGEVAWQSGYVPIIEDYRSVMLQRAVFQSVASMGLPAFTIHSIVRYSGRALKDAKNVRIRTYGPIGVSVTPLHPSIFWRAGTRQVDADCVPT